MQAKSRDKMWILKLTIKIKKKLNKSYNLDSYKIALCAYNAILDFAFQNVNI